MAENLYRSPQRDLKIKDFSYELPDGKIALFPMEQRDASKLLVVQGKHISEDRFFNIGRYLPSDSLLFFNNTKVVQARVIFHKQAGQGQGARIEIFCLEPFSVSDISLAFSQRGSLDMVCYIGNNKKWKQGCLEQDFVVGEETYILKAERLASHQDAFVVRFSWNSDRLSFAEVLEAVGKVPLPPYIQREAVEADRLTYQTVFARNNGSVAAPTAGLHFTQELIHSLQEGGIETEYLTLHVGAGTFKPVKDELVGQHGMHREQVFIRKEPLQHLIRGMEQGKRIISVGTTSTRTLESLYGFGVKLLMGMRAEEAFEVRQWDPYELYQDEKYSASEALKAVERFMEEENRDCLTGETSLMIAPGYEFRICRGMVTNFHQPQSTLLLLIAAMIGDTWKTAYDYALNHDFRFLSYGDSCLLLPD